jgi:hypothetical protein
MRTNAFRQKRRFTTSGRLSLPLVSEGVLFWDSSVYSLAETKSISKSGESCPLPKTSTTEQDYDDNVQSQSRYFVGTLTAVAEIVRRWHQLGQLSIWRVWLDDFVLAAFL